MQLKGTYREIWSIAWPIILGSLANSINQLIDTIFLGHYSKVALDAVTLSGIFFFNITFIAGGFARGCQVIIARHSGELNYPKIGFAFDHLLTFSVLLIAGMIGFFHTAAAPLIDFSVSSSSIRLDAKAFIGVMNYAVPPVVLGFCFNAFYSGIGKTRIITLATVLMAVTNIILDYVLIFGKLGFPALGIRGAAYATAAADYVLFLTYLFYFIYKRSPDFYRAFRFTVIRFREWRSIIQLSMPIVLQNLIALTAWQYFFICVERLGEHELAVSGILKSLFVFLGIPVWALASTSNTVVSNLIGQKRQDLVIPALKKVLVIAISISLSLNLLIVLFPHTILGLFSNDPVLIRDTIPPFYTLMVSLLFFAAAMVMNQGIIGTGATMIPAIVELLCSFAYVAYAWYFVYILRSPLWVGWGCELVYWLLLMLFTLGYWGSGAWKKYVRRIDTPVE